MNAAIVVAHPDDEIIWCGGLLLGHPDWDWTVFSLCRRDDADRGPKFHRVCAHVGARGIISDLDDSNPLADIDPNADIAPRIVRHLADTDWDLLLTHGANGEYGHPRHVQTHAAVTALVSKGALTCRRLWVFAYEATVTPPDCRPAPEADATCTLTDHQLAEKKHIVRDLYGYPADGFEVRACIATEALSRIRDDDTKGLTL